jgi:DnaJ-domain-containing protein 1
MGVQERTALRQAQGGRCFLDDHFPRDRFHGRVRGARQRCTHPGCPEVGEFRAPGYRSPNFDGPGDYQWLCLDHVRAFNARYNFFDGMSREEIEDAQMPMAGWATETRAFTQSGVDSPPKWADFHDPLDAISARFRGRMADAAPRPRADGKPLTGEDRRALKILGLDQDADRKALRARYSELVRKYHPDRNGGDRSFEKKLQAVVEAYQLLRVSPAFST